MNVQTRGYRPFSFLFLVVFILLVAAGLRLRGLAWGLPYLIDGDEFRVVNNGLSVYYTGEQWGEMGSYPPLRSWEIALTRALLVALDGEPVTTSAQIFSGRMVSVWAALLTVALLVRLGRGFFNPTAGVLAAGFFAGWSFALWYGQMVLVDGVALLFFVAALVGRRWLLVAGLAVLAKYTFFPVLLVGLWRGGWGISNRGQALLLLPLVALALRTVQVDNLVYDYLNPTVHLAYMDELAASGRLQPAEYARHSETPRSITARWWHNARMIWAALGGGVVVLGLVGAVLFWRRAALLLVVGGLGFVLVGGLIATGARQQFPALVCLMLLAAGVCSQHRVGVFLAAAFLLWSAAGARDDWAWRGLPDTHAATVEWFAAHAPDGARIASEPILYEFGRLHGYAHAKQFEVIQVENVFTDCVAADYRVVRGRALDGALLATFAPPQYGGEPRSILAGCR